MVGCGKRSFSNFKLIKTHELKLGNERLSPLIILLIENYIAENLNWITLINKSP